MPITPNLSKLNLSELRHETQDNPRLTLDNTPGTPWEQLEFWFKDALEQSYFQPNAMSLATVSQNSKPSCRIVLLKSFSPEGVIFYTHYQSRKGQELEHSPHAAGLIYWDTLERQVRLEGEVRKIPPETSDQYFSSRPYDSQISAIISPQSQKIPSREFLEKKQDYLKSHHNPLEHPLERPHNWGGYCLSPSYFEFWQGREGRLHDRVVYQKSKKTNLTWEKFLLAP